MSTDLIGSGETYTTLQSWEDDIPATLTEVEVGQCKNEGFTATSGTILTIDGHTTTGYSIRLTTATGASFRDHADLATNALTYNESLGAYIRNSGSYAKCVYFPDDNVQIDNLMIGATGTQGTAIVAQGSNASPTVKYNIIKGSSVNGAAQVYSSSGPGLFANNLVIQTRTSATRIALVYGYDVYNCTFVVPSGTTPATNGVFSNYGAFSHTNNLYFGCTNVESGSSTFIFTTCLSDDAAPPTGVTTATYADQFESATNDFRLKSGADAIDAGTTESNGSPSINGVTRPSGSSYDIGAWEFVAAGGGASGTSSVAASGNLQTNGEKGATAQGSTSSFGSTISIGAKQASGQAGSSISGSVATVGIGAEAFDGVSALSGSGNTAAVGEKAATAQGSTSSSGSATSLGAKAATSAASNQGRGQASTAGHKGTLSG